jgi:hypothetical protein
MVSQHVHSQKHRLKWGVFQEQRRQEIYHPRRMMESLIRVGVRYDLPGEIVQSIASMTGIRRR